MSLPPPPPSWESGAVPAPQTVVDTQFLEALGDDSAAEPPAAATQEMRHAMSVRQFAPDVAVTTASTHGSHI